MKYLDPDGEDLTLYINPRNSGLDLNSQLRLAAGVRQRYVNAGVRNGTLMAQAEADADMSEQGLLEFSEEDTTLLQQMLNEPEENEPESP